MQVRTLVNPLSILQSTNLVLVDEFISALFSLPPESDVVAEGIYASSSTLDGRRFAEEFVRRKKQADKGIFEGNANSVANFGREPEKSGEGKNSKEAWGVVGGKKKGKR